MRKDWRKTHLMQLVEIRHGQPIDHLLSRLYVDEGKTMGEVAEMLDVDEATISRWMERMNIPVRAPHPA